MVRKAKGTHLRTDPPAEAPASPKEEAPRGRIIERPDGFYWQSKESGEESGPFSTLAEAEADMQSAGDGELESSSTLQEAESELGISEWIDPDSGVPAEDSVPRIEDH
ncbi:MAG TPA: hypothetical protein VN929_01280 [Burkholderiales bacterium]|nr:hypothetical protein [Burkholderiales bacterium]